ncbi:Proline--tRNA ligase [Candidatus Trichorickettsia mobilis]|uniref:Proline--tRNA ligase n=1 Tax=Candidatus Trichorickettsia mobilis TaxID=1346319 RepID=A0ABZ0UU12_9RICK|nr:proline--tRNA ligase [Candidatus Trichorickettsia mobilis]WPY00473.1 Proline--tRNA ligase [Candidatus Trichorickettsia mobilis]
MLLSQYFLPTLKEQPLEAQIVSHGLMLRSGMIKQQAAGIYSWLPLGLKVLKNIENIIRFNMNAVGAVELLMPCVQPSNLWLESGRFNDYGKEMLKFQDRHDNNLLFGPTNEEMITDIFRSNIKSYKDLPKNLYQIQWKFRDEIRPRFGIMRGREFLMKDAYSFDIDYAGAIRSYNRMYTAYMHSFRDLGVSVVPVAADNGVIGGDLSHEFHIVADIGESTLYYDKVFNLLAEDLVGDIEELKTLYAAADDKHDPVLCPLSANELCVSKGIEVGHIFHFGTKYSKLMNAFVNDKQGNLVPVEMGSYGIGISRLVAAIIEANHDDRGIVWPEEIAPFKVSILNLNIADTKCSELSNLIYNQLQSMHIDVLYDNTDERAGIKFAIHDLIGSPWQIIIGNKNAANDLVEIKHRATAETEIISVDVAIKKVVGNLNVR